MAPGPTPDDSRLPTPADVLRWCAAAAPSLWFPSAHARDTGTPRDALDEPLWVLRQAGLVLVGDWVRGRGQGFVVTPAGQKALAEPGVPITVPPPAPPDPADDIPPEDADLAHVPAAAPAPARNPGITAYDRGERTRKAFLDPSPSVVARALIVLNVGWFLIALVTAWKLGVPVEHVLTGERDGVEVMVKTGAAYGPDVARGEWWRVGTAGFVHFGLLHLIMNMVTLAVVSPVAEELLGRWRFAGLYALAGLAASCAALALRPTGATAGASGSISGVLLAVLAWLVWYRHHLPADVVRAYGQQMFLVVGLSVAMSFLPNVSWEGHLAGGVAGFLSAVLLDRTRPGANRRQLTVGLGGLVVLVAAMGGGLAAAVKYSKKWQGVRAAVFVQDNAPRLQTTAAVLAVSPPRLEIVHRAVTHAVIARSESSLQRGREAVAALKADAAKAGAGDALGVNPDGLRAYLAEVERFADLVGEPLARGAVPDAAGWAAIADQRAKADEAWKRVVE